jgi:hypothetical protein
MKKLTKVIIKRLQWLRGEGGVNSYLYRGKDAKMCCLGFCARKRKFSIANLYNRKSPGELIKNITGLTEKNCEETTFCKNAITINDNIRISDKSREAKLKKLAPKMGFNFEFVD